MSFYKRQDDRLFYANIKVKLPVTTPNSYFEQIFDTMQNIEQQYNSYTPNSFLHTINVEAGKWVSVDNTCIALLKKSIEVAELFDGLYDITIFPLLELWGFYKKEQKKIPSDESLQDILKLVNYKSISFDKDKVKIEPNQKIISGSFIKAYAVDKTIELIKSFNIENALINAGGSTIFALANEQQEYWEIQITEPTKEIPNSLFKIKLKNKCFSTSIQSQSSLVVDGKKIGHIINAKTGLPTHNLQVGILSDNAMLGDMLSTAFILCNPEEFQIQMAKIQALYPDVEGFLIDEQEKIHYSTQFLKYIL